LELILGALPHGTIVLERGGRIVYANPAAERVTGTPPDELIGMSVDTDLWWYEREDGTRLAPNDHPAMLAFQSGKPEGNTTIALCREGHGRVWISVQSTPISTGPDGSVSLVLTTAVIITELKRAQDELNASHQHLSTILGSIGDGFYILNRNLEFVYLNERAASWMRGSVGTFMGRGILEFFPEVRHTNVFEAYQLALSEARSSSVELYFEPLKAWFEARIYPSQQGLSVYFRDISDRVLARVQLLQSEARYRALLDQVPAVIYTQLPDEQLTFTYVGPFVETLLGYSPDAFIGERNKWTQAIHPEDQERVRREVARVSQNGEQLAVEYRMIKRDGSDIWVADSAT
jgi:PAS domain S-box-containing protein